MIRKNKDGKHATAKMGGTGDGKSKLARDRGSCVVNGRVRTLNWATWATEIINVQIHSKVKSERAPLGVSVLPVVAIGRLSIVDSFATSTRNRLSAETNILFWISGRLRLGDNF